MQPGDAPVQRYRIWIAGYDDWEPTDWHDVPPQAIALEPAELFALSADQACSFLQGFNTEMLRKQIVDGRMHSGQMLRKPQRLWAVALPVVVRYEGEPRPGETVAGHRF